MIDDPEIIDPSAISEEHVSSDLTTVSQRLSSLSLLANEIAAEWQSANTQRGNRNTIVWNNFLVPGGRLLFRAADVGGFQASSRLQNVANQWTDTAVRNGGFSQYGNGFYPKRGDNWTSGQFATLLIDTYVYKIKKRTIQRRNELNVLQDCAFVFERVGNLIAPESPAVG